MVIPLQDVVNKAAKLYSTAIETGETTWHKGEGILKKVLPDYWFETKFNSGDIQATIWEWRHDLAADPYLNSITIKFKDRKVYQANVSRYDTNRQRIQTLSMNTDWLDAINIILKENNLVGLQIELKF